MIWRRTSEQSPCRRDRQGKMRQAPNPERVPATHRAALGSNPDERRASVPSLRNHRMLLRIAAALVAAAGTAACTGNDTVTLGTALQLSGNLAGMGRTYRDAYQFAVD